jgi:hypothetical protein
MGVRKTMKRRGRVLKVKRPSEKDVNMSGVEEEFETPDEDIKEVSRREIFKAHAGAWKTMKAQVALLKAQRTKLGKKERETKKAISKKIKNLISELRTKQDLELKSMGVIPPNFADRMEDVSDNE